MKRQRQRHFRLGTTSFIYPDHILPNVKKLGAFFDEIELLVFECIPESVVPSKKDVKELLAAAREYNLSYNIHLPTDISVTADSSHDRQKAADTYAKVLKRFVPLKPTTHTLHLEMPEETLKDPSGDLLKKWIENTYQGVKALLANGVNPDDLSIETLDYPFSLVEPVVEEFNLPVCMDLGHGIKYNYDISKIFAAHKSHIPIMHLHGVEFSDGKVKDHTRLDRMPKEHFDTISDILETYTGVVSLELFNLKNLNHSLAFFSQIFSDIPMGINQV